VSAASTGRWGGPAADERRTRSALLLVAHGSRDPRSGAAISALAARIARERPELPVAVSSLEHLGRRPVPVAAELAAAGAGAVTVVPLLLTEAYHGTVDVPAVTDEIAAALPGVSVTRSGVLGGDERLLAALDVRTPLVSDVDGVVLAAAGTRDVAARRGIAAVAARYAARHRIAGTVAYASGPGPDVPTAVHRLRATGCRRIVVASYFLAPGRLHDRIVAGAMRCGVPVGAPFAAARPLADLVLSRYEQVSAPSLSVA